MRKMVLLFALGITLLSGGCGDSWVILDPVTPEPNLELIQEFRLEPFGAPRVFWEWSHEVSECAPDIPERFEVAPGDSASLGDIRWSVARDTTGTVVGNQAFPCARFPGSERRYCFGQFIPRLDVYLSQVYRDTAWVVKHELIHVRLQDTISNHEHIAFCACTGEPRKSYGCWDEYKASASALEAVRAYLSPPVDH